MLEDKRIRAGMAALDKAAQAFAKCDSESEAYLDKMRVEAHDELAQAIEDYIRDLRGTGCIRCCCPSCGANSESHQTYCL